ncbi:hypothetical protein BKA62DRAFT_340787 [Auriculariales sp. MPI-PUGE-AT-0066]|nr:hypothetical protein BKA62DRAFT_340787 [Auriculariales sp. MPI-PUGE-AT-0066]
MAARFPAASAAAVAPVVSSICFCIYASDILHVCCGGELLAPSETRGLPTCSAAPRSDTRGCLRLHVTQAQPAPKPRASRLASLEGFTSRGSARGGAEPGTAASSGVPSSRLTACLPLSPFPFAATLTFSDNPSTCLNTSHKVGAPALQPQLCIK